MIEADHADEEDDRAEHRSASLHRRGLGLPPRRRPRAGRSPAPCRAGWRRSSGRRRRRRGCASRSAGRPSCPPGCPDARPSSRRPRRRAAGRSCGRRRGRVGSRSRTAGTACSPRRPLPHPGRHARPRPLRRPPRRRGRIGLGLFRRRHDVRGWCRPAAAAPAAAPATGHAESSVGVSASTSAGPPPRHRRRGCRGLLRRPFGFGVRPRPRRPAPARSSARFPPRLRRLPAPRSARRVTLSRGWDRLVGRRRSWLGQLSISAAAGSSTAGSDAALASGSAGAGSSGASAGAGASGSPAGSSAGGCGVSSLIGSAAGSSGRSGSGKSRRVPLVVVHRGAPPAAGAMRSGRS